MVDLSRIESLIGKRGVEKLAATRVVAVGIGGVGSWCVEALARSGVRRFTLIDDDVIVPSNLNRQCPATEAAMGSPKVEAMRERLLAIDSSLEVEARQERYERGDAAFRRADGERVMVVDAIDSVAEKAELILTVTGLGLPLVSSMGAAKRLDPTKVVVRRFDRVEGDALARALRRRFKRLGRYPSAKFNCVVSTEPAMPSVEKGSAMTVTCAFGMALAHEVLQGVL